MRFVNEASWDRIARVTLGVVLLSLGWFEVVVGGWGTFFKIIGFVPLATGLIGWCPLYAVMGCQTNRRSEAAVR